MKKSCSICSHKRVCRMRNYFIGADAHKLMVYMTGQAEANSTCDHDKLTAMRVAVLNAIAIGCTFFVTSQICMKGKT